MHTTIIIPTYNEADNIEDCISTVKQILIENNLNDSFSFLITDANSSDGTADIVKKLMVNDSRIHLIEEGSKQGIGKAYSNAMKKAFVDLNADAIITFDADLSHDPKVIPQMVALLETGADYVCGTRYRKGGGIPSNWGIHRKFLSIVGNLFIKILYFQAGLSDFTSGFKGFKKNVFEKIVDKISQHKGYTFSISTNIEAYRAGFKIHEVPYKFKDRTRGESKMGPEYLIMGFKFVTLSWISDMMKVRIIRVLLAGGVGAICQLLSYGLIFYPLFEDQNILNLNITSQFIGFSIAPRFLISQLFAIEVGVLSTFLVNNYWTFKDHVLHGTKLVYGFLKNNVGVSIAILIQLWVGQILEYLFGEGIVRHYTYQIIGILVGLIWNFYFYKKIVWKIKSK